MNSNPHWASRRGLLLISGTETIAEHLASMDTAGVALGRVKGLIQRLTTFETQQEGYISDLDTGLQDLDIEVLSLQNDITDLNCSM